MSEIRTRFAPSPTGYLHIGGARTALFSWLYARRHKGKFILRIEDTDLARSTPAAVEAILDGLAWMGIDWDEGPYFQTERFDLYKAQVKRLLEIGAAYYCNCPPEELEAQREQARKEGRKPKYNGRCRELNIRPAADKPAAVRFKCPLGGETVVDDLVKGRVVFNNAELDDLIIARSDGVPTYNFVVVVDDALMRITHIIRGDDHLNNTPRQILLYQALGFDLPRFAHLPLILGSDRTPLSKRHGATSVTAYREQGYLPQALVNFLARLGWGCGDEEVFSREELIKKFSLENVGKSAGVFNQEKLVWLNSHYIQNTPAEELALLLQPYLKERGLSGGSLPWLSRVVKTLQPRSKTLVEMIKGARFYFLNGLDYDLKLVEKFFNPAICQSFTLLAQRFNDVKSFDQKVLEDVTAQLIQDKGLKFKELAQPLRVALTNSQVSPGLFETMEALGKEKVISRLLAASKLV
ncbi:MAG: glutamate--tRNA ligase [Candidatus Schekmanbacteria bacterium]|nr:glutamate--tRNA ligase [Candidatus Schekmanbacteria bacterium]